MPANSTCGSSSTKPGPVFATTRWSEVLTAGNGDSLQAQDALAHLCQSYWYPLYAYARGRGASPHDAQDLTQEFFSRLLAGNWLAQADRERGRFRSFLLSAMKHFLANEWNRAHAQKRGGRQPVLSLNDDSAEERYRLEPVEQMTPETLFERGWALTLLYGFPEIMLELWGSGGSGCASRALPGLLDEGGDGHGHGAGRGIACIHSSHRRRTVALVSPA